MKCGPKGRLCNDRPMTQELKNELLRLAENAAMRRQQLLETGRTKASIGKALTIISGVVTLLSGGTITAVTLKWFGSDAITLKAAVVSLLSGLVSLFASTYLSNTDVVQAYTGSSKYLALREELYSLVIIPMPDAKLFTALKQLQKEYAALDSMYSRLFTRGSTSRTFEIGEEEDRFKSVIDQRLRD